MAKPNKMQAAFTELTPLCKAMGMQVTDVGEVDATISMPYSVELIGDPDTGVVHGGAVSVLLDSVSGLAVMIHPDNIGNTATIDLRIDYMRPAPPGQTLVARAEVYHTTQTVAFTRATTWADNPDKPIAQATGAFVFKRKADI
ncbi:PaaI family thioesterase [Amylibacter marinus]|nr:PaaI family thioesterase [Amylibacter marinus]